MWRRCRLTSLTNFFFGYPGRLRSSAIGLSPFGLRTSGWSKRETGKVAKIVMLVGAGFVKSSSPVQRATMLPADLAYALTDCSHGIVGRSGLLYLGGFQIGRLGTQLD